PPKERNGSRHPSSQRLLGKEATKVREGRNHRGSDDRGGSTCPVGGSSGGAGGPRKSRSRAAPRPRIGSEQRGRQPCRRAPPRLSAGCGQTPGDRGGAGPVRHTARWAGGGCGSRGGRGGALKPHFHCRPDLSYLKN